MQSLNQQAPTRDLTDAEFEELDQLLAATPEPFEPLDAVMLDGYLCGVLVQPVLIEIEAWLPHVFDFDGQPLPDDADPAWRERVTALITRRHAALNRSMTEDGWFDPLILEPDDFNPPRTDDPAASLNPVSQSLMPWVAGFQHALESFPDLLELPDPAVDIALARLYRHLPAQSDEEREVVATLDKEHPLPTLDDAIEDLIVVVADLDDLTRDLRYKVETVKREEPKVGRNDPCPCGSGKKFKQCHGKA
ncbi:MAG TPA: UPF0149 family protein [Piscinibacter sp.]|jgi:uncharacterized protein|uniref:UPF0149 family protein n=1 Tax=Piscinibacter sp. TaxID=1903157 RepID=UPI001B533B26|nr:UPF0149 family protein [Piscinibacter sp.]MBK7533511.1 UPF0149 family protein [Piscinibacter sp.]MBL0093455.1 UPF0149 family protein [Piscinibacter sp.]MBP6541688.1 UPF0149 family protein [Piscinibacter sp.]HPG79420.1 UPF0149 family protein [Piscinibacter sp.]HPM65811.1 UPF0149 family protein [Piscinibacter sp.]